MSEFSSQENPAIVLDGQPGRSAIAVRFNDHLTLTKPGITIMVVVTAFAGFAMGAADVEWSPIMLLVALVGTGLSCMGAGVFNHAYERDTDALMDRTRNRPLPTGRVSMAEALIAGTIYSILGVGLLWIGANWLAAVISALTIFGYALVYTPLKRVHSISTAVGTLPGATAPLIGYAVVTGRIGLEAVLLFAIMVVWQLPHFYAIGLLYRDDYARAGMPILPVIDATGRRTHIHILVTSIALLIVGLLPSLLGVSGPFAFVGALICGVGFLGYAIQLIRNPTRKQARALFLASLVYLPVVLTVVLLDQV